MNFERTVERLERKLKQIQSLTSHICVSLDPEGRIIFANQQFLNLTGWKPEDILGQGWFDIIVAPAMRKHVRETFFRFMEHDTEADQFTCKNDIVSRHGTIHTVAWTNILSRSEQRRIVDVTSLGVVISERERHTDALRMSEERLQLAQKATNAVIWDLDIANGRQVWSETGKVQFGWPESTDLREFLAWWGDRLHPDDRTRVKNSFDAFLNNPSHAFWQDEYRFLKADGTYASIMDQGYALRDEHGCPLRVIGAMQDITQHVRLEEKVRLQAMVLDQIQECVTVTDLTGGILYCNDAQAKAPVSSEDDCYVLGVSALDENSNHKRTRSQILERTLHDGQWQGEIIRRTPDGHEIILDCRMCVIRDATGEAVALCETTSDVTERKRTSEALRHESLRRKTLMQKSNDGIAIFDHEHRIIEANERFAEMLGYPIQELVGMHTWDFEAEITKEQILALPLVLMNNNVIETRHRRKDGSVYHAEVSASAVSLCGEYVIFTISRDITARKQTERELMEARRRAEAASRIKSEFLANMSHEIRTPLNGILGMLQLLQTTPLSGEQTKITSLAIQSNIRLTRLLSDILDLSQVEAGMVAIQSEPFSLRETLSMVLELFGPAAALQDDVKLLQDFDPNLPESVIGDSLRLSQVLTNLLGNAFKFTSKGFVKVEAHVLPPLKPGHARLYFSVADTGCGIPADVLKNLFEPFTQGVQGYTRSFQGAGLGLAICKKLIHLLGGKISVETEVDVGTAFHFCLSFPLEQTVQVQKVLPQSATKLASGRVLLAEDDPVNRFAVSSLLAKAGYQVASTENGQEALALYEKEHFDVIIMDIQMPVMDGVEATRLIRAKETERGAEHTPIIALTSYARKEDGEAFLAAGMDAHMAKPAEMNELRRVIDEVRRVNCAFFE
jgi:PAS domain S-box-containing protein